MPRNCMFLRDLSGLMDPVHGMLIANQLIATRDPIPINAGRPMSYSAMD